MIIDLEKAIELGFIKEYSTDKSGYTIAKNRRKLAEKYEVEIPSEYRSLDEYLFNLLKGTKPSDYKCKVCGKQNPYKGGFSGYMTTCCESCRRKMLQATYTSPESRAKRIATVRRKMESDPDYKERINKGLIKGREDKEIRIKAQLKAARTKRRLHNQFCIDNDCSRSWDLVAKYGQGWYKAGVGRSEWIEDPKLRMTYIPNKLIPQIEEYFRLNEGCHRSHGEESVLEYIKSIYAGEVLSNTRKVIGPKELDIYIPDKKVAIEYNGLYWHKEDGRIPEKIDLCEEKGIRLISIYDFQWTSRTDICKSIIASALGVYDKKISARECEFKSISSSEFNAFCDENHIHGRCVNGKWNYGLFYEGELVQAISLGKDRFSKSSDDIELYRMVTRSHYSVRGGFSKLLKNFSRSTGVKSIVSFIDRTFFNGQGYKSVGAVHLYNTDSRYYYKKGDQILNRVSAMKYKLKDLLGEGFNPDLTERENMLNNGWMIIYDGGNEKVRIDL